MGVNLITYQGRSQTIAAWAREFGLNGRTLELRLKRGWTTEKALSTKPRKSETGRWNPRMISYQGRTQTIAEWAREFGVAPDTLRNRLRLGWSMEDALRSEKPRKSQEKLEKKRKPNLFEYQGRSQTLNAWATELGIPASRLRRRIAKGWEISKAIELEPNEDRLVEYKGEFRSVESWAKEIGISTFSLRDRLKKGWSLEKALNTPTGKLIECRGKAQTIKQWSEETGVKICTIRARLRYGWSLEQALGLSHRKLQPLQRG